MKKTDGKENQKESCSIFQSHITKVSPECFKAYQLWCLIFYIPTIIIWSFLNPGDMFGRLKCAIFLCVHYSQCVQSIAFVLITKLHIWNVLLTNSTKYSLGPKSLKQTDSMRKFLLENFWKFYVISLRWKESGLKHLSRSAKVHWCCTDR